MLPGLGHTQGGRNYSEVAIRSPQKSRSVDCVFRGSGSAIGVSIRLDSRELKKKIAEKKFARAQRRGWADLVSIGQTSNFFSSGVIKLKRGRRITGNPGFTSNVKKADAERGNQWKRK